MYEESLMQLSPHELTENLNRLLLAAEELRYFYDSLNEEKDELLSTNMMYKETLYNLLRPSKNFSKTLVDSLKKLWESPASQWKDTMKKIVQDPITESDPFLIKPKSPRLKFLHVDPFFSENPHSVLPSKQTKRTETTYAARYNSKGTNSNVKY